MKKSILIYIMVVMSSKCFAQWRTDEKEEIFHQLILGPKQNFTRNLPDCLLFGLCFRHFRMHGNRHRIRVISQRCRRFIQAFVMEDSVVQYNSMSLLYFSMENRLVLKKEVDFKVPYQDTIRTVAGRYTALTDILPFEKHVGEKGDTAVVIMEDVPLTPPNNDPDSYFSLLAAVTQIWVHKNFPKFIRIVHYTDTDIFVYDFPKFSDFKKKRPWKLAEGCEPGFMALSVN